MNKRRFIAGAICPQCREIDKIVIYTEEGVDVRECVRCDYKDVQSFKSAPSEPTTRVNKSRSEREEEAQPVQIKFVP